MNEYVRIVLSTIVGIIMFPIAVGVYFAISFVFMWATNLMIDKIGFFSMQPFSITIELIVFFSIFIAVSKIGFSGNSQETEAIKLVQFEISSLREEVIEMKSQLAAIESIECAVSNLNESVKDLNFENRYKNSGDGV